MGGDGSGRGRAGLAGAGFGTALVALGKSLHPGFFSSLLLYGSPSISVVAGILVFYVEIVVMTLLRRRLFNQLRERVQPTLDDPNASPDHKARLRKDLEAAERALVQAEARSMKLIGRSPR